MEFNLLPQSFEAEAMKKVKKYKEKAENKLKQKTEALEEETLDRAKALPEYLQKHPNGDFKDYLHTLAWYKSFPLCLWLGALAAAVLLLLMLIKPPFAADFINELEADFGLANPFVFSIVFGFLFCICFPFGRAFAAYFYGIVFCFIFFPIYRSCHNRAIKRWEQNAYRIADQGELSVAQLKEKTESKILAVFEQTQREIANYREAFNNQVQLSKDKYIRSPLTKEIAQWVTSNLRATVEAADRGPSVETINALLILATFNQGVDCFLESYSDKRTFLFEEHRYPALTSAVEVAALGCAIVELVKRIYTSEFPVDPSQTAYTFDYFEDESAHEFNVVEFRITYTAPNANYQPLKSW